MALRVWLPLNGSLENIGINGIEPQLMGTGITYTAGKLGNAATFPNNCNSCIHMPGLRLQVGTWTAWIKVNGAGATTRQCIISEGRDSATDGVEFYTNQAGTTLTFKAHSKTLSTTITLNTWYHVAGVFGNGNITFYVNGNQVGTTTYTGGMTYTYASDFTLGKMSYSYTNTSNYFSFNGQLNDVRIYDEVLSIKEIKEIAQGLVLHYKLDGANSGVGDNLYTGTKEFTGSWNGSGNWTTSSETYKDFTVKQRSATWGGLSQNIPCTQNDIFTISFYAKVDSGGTLISIHRSNLGNVTTGLQILNGNFSGGSTTSGNWVTASDNGTQWKRYWATVKIIQSDITYLQWRIENSVADKNLYVCGFKMERGNIATAWTPAPNELGIDTTKVTDSSGFGHNGIIVNATTENISPDGRYQVCTNLLGTTVDNSSNTITGAQYLYSNFTFPATSAITYAWWGNNIAYGRGGILETTATTGNIWEGSDYNTTAIANWDSTFGIYNGTTRINIYSNFPKTDAIWHHHAITFNGTNVIYYKDGIAVQTSALTGALPAITGFKMGLGRAGGVYRQIKQKISDFRIYATALSADDILDLYHTSANIDNLQNIHEFELDEILNQQPSLNWRDPSLIIMNGWSGSATYNTSQDYLVLTATNGWRTFAWKTNEAQGKTCLLEFDYYIADATNLSSTGIFVINLDAVAYGTPLLTLNSTTGQWHHCSYTVSTAQKFVGINIRGTDNTGNSVIVWLRNLKIQEINASSNLSQIYQNGVTATGQFHEEGSEWLHSTTGGTFTPTDKSNNTIHYSVVDLRSYATLNQDITVRIEADASWTAFTAGSAGTFNGVWFQGANFPVGATTSSWSGTNYICNALNNQYNLRNATTITTAGAYHYDTTATIPASWFANYERSNVGMRCDYSNGTGTFTLRNLKVTPLVNYYNAKIGKDFISANQFIEK